MDSLKILGYFSSLFCASLKLLSKAWLSCLMYVLGTVMLMVVGAVLVLNYVFVLDIGQLEYLAFFLVLPFHNLLWVWFLVRLARASNYLKPLNFWCCWLVSLLVLCLSIIFNYILSYLGLHALEIGMSVTIKVVFALAPIFALVFSTPMVQSLTASFRHLFLWRNQRDNDCRSGRHPTVRRWGWKLPKAQYALRR